MVENKLTGEMISENNPYASVVAGVGYTNPYEPTLLGPAERQEQYVAEQMQANNEAIEGGKEFTLEDLGMTARMFIDGLWLNKQDEVAAYAQAAITAVLQPDYLQGGTIAGEAKARLAEREAEVARFEEDRPITAMASNIVGSIISPVSLAGGQLLANAQRIRSGQQTAQAGAEVASRVGTRVAAGSDELSQAAKLRGSGPLDEMARFYNKQTNPLATRVANLTPTVPTPGLLNINPVIPVAAGVAAAEGGAIGFEGETLEEKAKNGLITAGISAAVPFAFAGVKKTYDFATESKMGQQLGKGGDFVNLMFTEHGASQIYRNVVTKAYGGRSLSEQQARQVFGRALTPASAVAARTQLKADAGRKTKLASASIRQQTAEEIEYLNLDIDEQIANVKQLAKDAIGQERVRYNGQLAALQEAKVDSSAARAWAVKEADASVGALNASFRGQALREASPPGATADDINSLGALDPQDAMRKLDSMWSEHGFKVADGKQYTIDKGAATGFIEKISKDFPELALVESGGIVSSVMRYVDTVITDTAPSGVIKGEDLLQMRSQIGRAINGLSNESTSTRQFATRIQDYFHDLLEEGLSTAEKATFAADRKAWSVKSFVNDATAKASGGDARKGAFEASDYLNAVRQYSPRFAARGMGTLQREAQDVANIGQQNKQNIIDLANEQAAEIAKDAIHKRQRLSSNLVNAKTAIETKRNQEVAALNRQLSDKKQTAESRRVLKTQIEEVKERYALQLADADSQVEKATQEAKALAEMLPGSFKSTVFENLFNTVVIGQTANLGQANITTSLATGVVGARLLSQEYTQRMLARQTRWQAGLRGQVDSAAGVLSSRGPLASTSGAAALAAETTAPEGMLFSEERKRLVSDLPISGKVALYRNLEAKGMLDRLQAEDPKLFNQLKNAVNSGK